MQLRDSASLLDILSAARLIMDFRGALAASVMVDDPKTLSAILYQLMVIGEATKRLSEELRSSHADIPWRQMAGMRDQLIHQYDDVDAEIVFQTATRDLPRLIARIEDILGTAEAD